MKIREYLFISRIHSQQRTGSGSKKRKKEKSEFLVACWHFESLRKLQCNSILLLLLSLLLYLVLSTNEILQKESILGRYRVFLASLHFSAWIPSSFIDHVPIVYFATSRALSLSDGISCQIPASRLLMNGIPQLLIDQ